MTDGMLRTEETKMAEGCFLILCGIPASGKSTLAKDLIQENWKIAGKCVHFIYINYDDFIPDNLPVDDLKHSVNWKCRRRDVINSIQQLLLANQNIGLASESQVSSHKNMFVSSWCSCGVNSLIRSSDILHVVMIDDNMFYRSMRYEYFQLARRTSFSFAEIYLHCPLDVALTQNAQRSASVSEDTIVKMFHRIDKPEPAKFNWEKFSVTIDSNNSSTDNKWKTIMNLLENATTAPAPPLKELDDAEKVTDRAITEKSIVHQADQVIRKYISQKMEEMRAKNKPSDMLKQKAQSLNLCRKTIMEKIKKEPEQIINHLFSCRFSGCYLDAHNLTKPAVNETKQSIRSSEQAVPFVITSSPCDRVSLGHHSDEHLMYETFVWGNFWDVVSVQEFGDVVRNIFEQL